MTSCHYSLLTSSAPNKERRLSALTHDLCKHSMIKSTFLPLTPCLLCSSQPTFTSTGSMTASMRNGHLKRNCPQKLVKVTNGSWTFQICKELEHVSSWNFKSWTMAVTSGLIPSITTILSFICPMCLRGKLLQLIRWRAMHNSVSTANTLLGWDNPLPVTGGPIQSAPALLHKFFKVAFFRFRRWHFPPPLAASLLSFTR